MDYLNKLEWKVTVDKTDSKVYIESIPYGDRVLYVGEGTPVMDKATHIVKCHNAFLKIGNPEKLLEAIERLGETTAIQSKVLLELAMK